MRTWRMGWLVVLVGCGTSAEAGDAPLDDVGGEDVVADVWDGADTSAPDGSAADTNAADTNAADATAPDGSAADTSGPDASSDGGAMDASPYDGEAGSPDAPGDSLLTDSAGGDTRGDSAVTDAASGDTRADSVVVDAVADAPADATDAADAADAAVANGPITGGPCSSGATGATAFRLRWAGSGAGSTAYAAYDVEGLPDKTTLHMGAYGYSIGYTPTFDDPFLGVGGLALDSSGFVDVDFSTVGLTSITRATLSIKGRSFNTTASGSFSWQTASGVGATPSGAVANSAPYAWYGPLPFLGSGGPIGDVTAVVQPGKTIKLRIKAGPPSGSLVVNLIELCLEAT